MIDFDGLSLNWIRELLITVDQIAYLTKIKKKKKKSAGFEPVPHSYDAGGTSDRANPVVLICGYCYI
jgi:hypothetical protein